MSAVTVGHDPKLDAVVRCIVDAIQPELVVLFGSRARGDARRDSDYDLLIVTDDESGVEAERRSAADAIRSCGLTGVELLVRSVEQYQRWQMDPGMLDYVISREGIVQYSRRGAGPGTGGRVGEHPASEGLRMWIRRAESDYREARNSLASAEPVWDAICFHAHASVEKLIKAHIVSGGTFPPRTHNLTDLLAMVPHDVVSPVVRDACELLSGLYPKSRYPDAGEPTPDEARRAFAAAGAARTLLLDGLPRLD